MSRQSLPCRAGNLVPDAIFTLKLRAITMSSYSPKPMLQSRDFRASEPTRHPRNPRPDTAQCSRRPTEAAFLPRVLNPAPLFLLGAGIETRHTNL